MKKTTAIIVVLYLAFGINTIAQKKIDYVNAFIGTANFGATNPGAVLPHGMVSVVPFDVNENKINKWSKDKRWWSTPYSWDNQFLTGFSQVNLSGVGCPDLGVILVMPTTGKVNANAKQYGSVMSGQRTIPGFFSCYLDRYLIGAEVTATQRTGLNKFSFPMGKESNILIDLGNGLTNESGGSIQIINNQELEGWRMTGNFCYHGNSERPVYFVARFNKTASSFGVWKKMPPLQAEDAWSDTGNKFKYYNEFMHPVAGDSIGAWFTFDTYESEEIMVEVGVSYVSIDNARKNLQSESKEFEFWETRKEAAEIWEKTLSRIDVEGGTEDQKTVFYTALYHMNIHPNILNDVNGEYPEMESYKIGKVEGYERYTVFSLWDTYRNLHPFMSLVYPHKQLDMVRSMVDMYKESGWLPKWELNSKETYTMDGDPAFPVITDTYLRGIKDFDVEKAYEAMLKSATTPQKDNKIRPDFDFYLTHGYMPLREEFDQSVSDALEYYLADWSLGQLAKVLGKVEDYKKFNNRSLEYKNYFDKKEYKMLRPKLANGEFLKDFNPLQGKNFEPVPGFHEGTAWQYTFGVPHDLEGLIKLMGGKKKFTQKLQHIFNDSLFDMANEPDMHYPYLFDYIKGEEWRTQKEVNRLISTYFKNAPDGLPGNDDCGTMSAWVAFGMMGIYPVCPGNMDYALTTPVFDKVVIHLDNCFYEGDRIEMVKTITNESKGSCIKNIKWNDQPLERYFINHQVITKGGKLEFIVGKE